MPAIQLSNGQSSRGNREEAQARRKLAAANRQFLIEMGKRLYKERVRLDLTQAEVAKGLWVGAEAYRSYEDGRHPMPYAALMRLPLVLHRPVTYFMGIQEDLGLSDDERRLVDVYRSIHWPEVRQAIWQTVVAQVAVDERLSQAAAQMTEDDAAPPAE